MRSFSNQGVMYLAVEMMLLRRPQARGQYQPVQVIKARHVAELEKVNEIRSTNGDAKALKPRHCEYFMIVLSVCVCSGRDYCINNGSKQKARPKGVNLKVR